MHYLLSFRNLQCGYTALQDGKNYLKLGNNDIVKNQHILYGRLTWEKILHATNKAYYNMERLIQFVFENFMQIFLFLHFGDLVYVLYIAECQFTIAVQLRAIALQVCRYTKLFYIKSLS